MVFTLKDPFPLRNVGCVADINGKTRWFFSLSMSKSKLPMALLTQLFAAGRYTISSRGYSAQMKGPNENQFTATRPISDLFQSMRNKYP